MSSPVPEFIRTVPRTLVRTRQQSLHEYLQPCGQFRSLVDPRELLSVKAAEYLARFSREQTLREESGIPRNWQHLLSYLQQEGIIATGGVHFRTNSKDWPLVPGFMISVDRSRKPTDGYIPRPDAGFGSDFDGEVALSKAIGETLERYFMSTYQTRDMEFDSCAGLRARGINALDVSTYDMFTAEQKVLFPEFAHDVNTPLLWSPAESLGSGERTMLPSQLVFWNYKHILEHTREPVLNRVTTSGCAGHFSRDEAILSGLLELIQRDAFLIFWLNRLSPPRLHIDALEDDELRSFIAYIHSFGIQLTILDMTSDIPVPTIVCVASRGGESRETVYSIGAGTGFDVKREIIKSVIEAVLVNEFVSTIPKMTLPESYKPFADPYIGRNERLALWQGPHFGKRLDFLQNGIRTSMHDMSDHALRDASPKHQLQYIQNELASRGKGYEPYVYDAVDPVLTKIGFHVVRTFVPALVPLYLREHAAPLANARLQSVPRFLGYSPSETFNPWPHPFP